MGKIVDIFQKSKIGILSFLFGYVVFLGYLYNFFQFNVGLKFNIFDYMDIIDMILTLIVDINFIYIIVTLILVVLLKIYPKNKKVLSISIVLILILIFLLADSLNIKNSDYKIIIYLIFLFLLTSFLFCRVNRGIKLHESDIKILNDEIDSKEILLMYKNILLIYQTSCRDLPKLNVGLHFNETIDKLNSKQNINLIDSFFIGFYKIKKDLIKIKNLSMVNILKNKDLIQELNHAIKYLDNNKIKIIKFQNKILLKEIINVSLILLVCASVFGFLGSRINNFNKNQIEIKLVRNIDPENKTQLYKLYKVTSTYIIVKNSNNEIVVFNKDDVSFVKFVEETTEQNSNLSNECTKNNYSQIELNTVITETLNNYFNEKDNKFALSLGKLIIPIVKAELNNELKANFDSLFKTSILNKFDKYQFKREIEIDDLVS